MGVARVDATCTELHDLLGLVVVEDIDKLIIHEMSCLQEHRHTILLGQATGSCRQVTLFADGLAKQNLRLGNIGGDDASHGHQLRFQHLDGALFDESVPRGRHHHGVEHHILYIVLTQHAGYTLHHLGRVEHAYLDAIGTDIAEYGIDLPLDNLYGESLHGIHSEGVLCGNGGDGRSGKATIG